MPHPGLVAVTALAIIGSPRETPYAVAAIVAGICMEAPYHLHPSVSPLGIERIYVIGGGDQTLAPLKAVEIYTPSTKAAVGHDETIDFAALEVQPGDAVPTPFSDMTGHGHLSARVNEACDRVARFPAMPQVNCWITHTSRNRKYRPSCEKRSSVHAFLKISSVSSNRPRLSSNGMLKPV